MRPLACLALACLCLSAAAPPATQPAALLKLIDDLGNDQTREAAAKKLEAMGEDILGLLRSKSAIHPDADVRVRLVALAAAIEKSSEVRRFAGHTEGVVCLALSPDGKRIASGSWLDDTERLARVWDVETGKEVQRFDEHTAAVTCAAFLPDGRHALTSAQDRTLRLWKLRR